MKIKINKSIKKVVTIISLSFFMITCNSTTDLPDPLQAGWKNKKVCSVLKENKKVRTLKCIFPPGVGHEKHFHAAHFGYTISGSKFKITDSTGTREVDIPDGYDFYNKEIKWHRVLNIGKKTAVFLIVEPK